jgi:hypothetical protein
VLIAHDSQSRDACREHPWLIHRRIHRCGSILQ